MGAKGVEELHNESLFVSKGYKRVKRDKAGAMRAAFVFYGQDYEDYELTIFTKTNKGL
ncbi:MAG: hypothetical protein ACLSFW_19635 [Bacteroides cellulosilyticus]